LTCVCVYVGQEGRLEHFRERERTQEANSEPGMYKSRVVLIYLQKIETLINK